MANNRMWLRIKDQPDKKILLAKYYPSTGWCIFYTEKELNEWFAEFLNFENVPDQDWVDGQWGKVNLELAFETDQEELEEIRIHMDLKNLNNLTGEQK